VASALFVGLALIVLLVPVDFVARSPGQAVDLTGEAADGGPVLALQGRQTYASSGSWLLTTVDQTPVGERLHLLQAIVDYLLPSHEVLDRSDVYQDGTTAEALAEGQAGALATAKTYAIVAALCELEPGPASDRCPLVDEYVTVADITAGGPSDGKLQKGDRLLLVQDTPIMTRNQLVSLVRSSEAGANLSVTICCRANDAGELVESTQSITLAKSAELGLPTMGVTWEQHYDYGDALANVTFDLGPAVTGDGGGLALALALYDQLVPEDLTGGQTVAAAGTLALTDQTPASAGDAPAATVEAADGIRQQAVTAAEQGATLFLIPRANCPDVADLNVGLRIVPVSTFTEAARLLAGLADGADVAAPACG
jgi:PDZ domain-containing protein